MTNYQIKSLILGHAIGDALGVPVEFRSRHSLLKDPVIDIRGFGNYNEPAGTWSDDTSMTLGLLESLGRLGKIDYHDIMKNFLLWMNNSEFTATDHLFDIGITTRCSLMDYEKNKNPFCGGTDDHSNGNGSLMRISPIALYLYNKSKNNLTNEDLLIVHNISKMTHGHIRSQMGCGIYVFIAVEIINGEKLSTAILKGIKKAYDFYKKQPEFSSEISTYNNIWDIKKFAKLQDHWIKSTGYIVYSLEAVLWCLLNTDNYAEAVLTAVNLGDDTDTIGAITGGLGGLYYGLNNIPPNWKKELKKYSYIEKLCKKFARKFNIK